MSANERTSDATDEGGIAPKSAELKQHIPDHLKRLISVKYLLHSPKSADKMMTSSVWLCA